MLLSSSPDTSAMNTAPVSFEDVLFLVACVGLLLLLLLLYAIIGIV